MEDRAMANVNEPLVQQLPLPVLAGPDLRERLLNQLGNIELRTKYLATRTPEWANTDLHLAHTRLMTVRMVKGIFGLALVGTAGGALGDLLLSAEVKQNGGGAWPVAVALGSALSGALSFAVLGALGIVVLPEVVGEEWESRHGSGLAGFFSRVQEPVVDGLFGGFWGGLCGLFIGGLTWGADITIGLPRFGMHDRVLAGATGGVLLGCIFGLLILALSGSQPGTRAQRWSLLGPLPLVAYGCSLAAVRKRYLRK